MNYGVLPLSAVGSAPFSIGMFLNGVFGHALFVGLPIALCARRAGGESGPRFPPANGGSLKRIINQKRKIP